MLTASHWAANSQVYAENISNNTKNYVYACMITATFILIHSAFINKFKMTTIRFCTDGSCWSMIFASICFILDIGKPNSINDAFFINLCVYAIFGTTVQLCDNYMTFSRYLIVYPKTSTRFKAAVYFFFCFYLIFTYLPYVTILPCFVDTNSDKVSTANTITAEYIFIISYLSFNLFFSYKFWRAIQSQNAFGGGGNNRKLLILGVKNLLHSLISSIGVVLQGIENHYGFAPAGRLTSYVTVNVSLHFLFNWRIEKAHFPFKPHFLRSSSVDAASSHPANNSPSRFERGLNSIISSIKLITTNRPSNSTSMLPGGPSIKKNGSGSQLALANQSPRLQEHQPDPIIRMPSRDSHIHPSTVESLMHPPSRDSYLAGEKERERGNHILRNSLKEVEIKGDDVDENKSLDNNFSHKSSNSNLRTLSGSKVYVEPQLDHAHSSNNNRQTMTAASAATATTAVVSIFKRRESDCQNHHVEVIERKSNL